MGGSERYVNSTRVVHETIDGETILIHLDTGAYYSLDGAGADAWELLAAGSTVSTVAAALARGYDADPDTIAGAVGTLVAELTAEQLLEPASQPAENGRAPAATIAAAEAMTEFEAPVLRKYTDMQEFRLVDPIHETDDTGWPNAAPVEPG